MLRLGRLKPAAVLCALLLTLGCGGGGDGEGQASGGSGSGRGASSGGGPGGASGGGPGGPGGGFGGGERQAAVPVEVTPVVRRDIASFIETNGTLEAESEVDIVARTAGPIVELRAEETMTVRQGQLLARLDQDEVRARLEVSRVAMEEAETAFTRAETLQRENLISSEEFEQARSRLDSTRAEFKGNEIQMAYTQIRAPFSGLIVERYIKFAETVAVGQPLFRLSDFDPLLCPIQVPERELPRLEEGQRAHVTVDAWPEERFDARVLRISPVIDSATGTIKVTLEVEAAGKLRPGMFTSVFLQTDTREGALVVPKAALALDSIGDAVFVADGGAAARREVTLGVREGDYVEVLSGLQEGEQVVSVGQDSLSDGTPIEVLAANGPASLKGSGSPEVPGSPEGGGPGGQGGADAPDGDEVAGAVGRGGRGGPVGELTPERIEIMKQRMRDGGLSEEQIEERIERLRQRAAASTPAPSDG